MSVMGDAIRIDGAEQSGSGTIVRLSVALAALLGRRLHVVNARARRAAPGLRPQHLAAVQACAALCAARTEGLAVGAAEFVFEPGERIEGGQHAFDIGTAGSTTMLALGVLPLACFARTPLIARITGGVFQDFAPSPLHVRHVLAPMLARMGIAMELRVLRPGYVPGGAGEIELRVTPVGTPLAPLRLVEQGRTGRVEGLALASHLAERKVADRMARACESRLAVADVPCEIAREDDALARHPGASLALWTETSTGARLGADRAGARRRSAESIGRFVADRLLEDLATGATTDRHLADQLVPFAALARGVSEYVVPLATEHVVTNLWLVERFGARARLAGDRVRIEGIDLAPGR